jgi:hypothetical protein
MLDQVKVRPLSGNSIEPKSPRRSLKIKVSDKLPPVLFLFSEDL